MKQEITIKIHSIPAYLVKVENTSFRTRIIQKVRKVINKFGVFFLKETGRTGWRNPADHNDQTGGPNPSDRDGQKGQANPSDRDGQTGQANPSDRDGQTGQAQLV